jgi:hypothetical protein
MRLIVTVGAIGGPVGGGGGGVVGGAAGAHPVITTSATVQRINSGINNLRISTSFFIRILS